MNVNDYNRRQATLLDVCREAGVSTATVSRVVNNSPLVSADTKRRVQEAIHKLDYSPSLGARSLVKQETRTIGVILPEIEESFFAEVMRGIGKVCKENDFLMLASCSHAGSIEKDLLVSFARGRRVDALIIFNAFDYEPGDGWDAHLLEVAEKYVPLVLIDRPVAQGGIPVVGIDNYKGARLAMSHALEHKPRQIGLLVGSEHIFDSRERLRGFLEEASARGLSIPQQFILRGDMTEASGERVVDALLESSGPVPDMLVCVNDAMACGAMAALRRRGLRAPDHMALIGFDDVAVARHVGLTTVRWSVREVGEMAARHAIEVIQGREVPGACLCPAVMMVRNSCGCGQGAVRP